MATRSCLLLFLFATLIQGRAFPHPSPTSPSEANARLWQGWTPKQTPDPLGKRFGAISERGLFARQDDISGNTCGWLEKNPAYPLTCGSGRK